MRRTVPFLSGICRRGPSVGSSAVAMMVAGVALVRQMSVEYHSGSSAFTCTNGAGPSKTTTALPRASCPVTTRLTGFVILRPHALRNPGVNDLFLRDALRPFLQDEVYRSDSLG